jgi:hypothetical protein
VNNLSLDNHPFPCYIYLMNDDFRDMMPTSQELYADMAPAPIDENSMTPAERDEYEREYTAYLKEMEQQE